MSAVDLSYAKKLPPEKGPVTLAIDTRGWAAGWALVEGETPVNAGFLSPHDHMDGRPVPPSHKVAGVFQNLIKIAVEAGIDMVVVEAKSKPGPIWTVGPLVAVATRARFAELRGWMEDLNLDSKSVRSWATVVLGKPPEDDLVATALGLGAVAAKLRARHGTVPDERA
jgi:hypothetical protein